jgi:hypothetical protein
LLYVAVNQARVLKGEENLSGMDPGHSFQEGSQTEHYIPQSSLHAFSKAFSQWIFVVASNCQEFEVM